MSEGIMKLSQQGGWGTPANVEGFAVQANMDPQPIASPPPFQFTEPPPIDPRTPLQYAPLNGRELGHILYTRTNNSLNQHHMFQAGLVYKEADFALELQLALPDQEVISAGICHLSTTGRNGGEIYPRLHQVFADAMSKNHLFQEGLAYKMFTARMLLHVDSANMPQQSFVVMEYSLTGDDSPDRARLAHGLPTQARPPVIDDPQEQEEPAEVVKVEGPIVEVGDIVSHPNFAGGQHMLVERVNDEGYHVRRENSPTIRKIGKDSQVYREIKIVEKHK